MTVYLHNRNRNHNDTRERGVEGKYYYYDYGRASPAGTSVNALNVVSWLFVIVMLELSMLILKSSLLVIRPPNEISFMSTLILWRHNTATLLIGQPDEAMWNM